MKHYCYTLKQTAYLHWRKGAIVDMKAKQVDDLESATYKQKLKKLIEVLDKPKMRQAFPTNPAYVKAFGILLDEELQHVRLHHYIDLYRNILLYIETLRLRQHN